MKFYLKKKLSIVLSVLVTGLFITSCSKKSDTISPTQGKTAKFTITVIGAGVNDVIYFGFNGNSVNGSTSLWKINEVVQNNQQIVALTEKSFLSTTTTYTIESNTPLTGPIVVDVSCLANGHYTVSFKSEINGVVKENDQNISVTPASGYSPTFTY